MEMVKESVKNGIETLSMSETYDVIRRLVENCDMLSEIFGLVERIEKIQESIKRLDEASAEWLRDISKHITEIDERYHRLMIIQLKEKFTVDNIEDIERIVFEDDCVRIYYGSDRAVNLSPLEFLLTIKLGSGLGVIVKDSVKYKFENLKSVFEHL